MICPYCQKKSWFFKMSANGQRPEGRIFVCSNCGKESYTIFNKKKFCMQTAILTIIVFFVEFFLNLFKISDNSFGGAFFIWGLIVFCIFLITIMMENNIFLSKTISNSSLVETNNPKNFSNMQSADPVMQSIRGNLNMHEKKSKTLIGKKEIFGRYVFLGIAFIYVFYQAKPALHYLGITGIAYLIFIIFVSIFVASISYFLVSKHSEKISKLINSKVLIAIAIVLLLIFFVFLE